jgi:phenylpropionate dioxygenase-like ring-hydroxylating dioxygenase large terminal subunit
MLPIDLDQTQVDVGKGYGLPSLFYTSSEVLSLERKEIFGTAWQYAVHRDQLREPNSYAVTSLGDFSVVVTRDAAGTLRAFRNVCLHRGATVAVRCGKSAALRCRYHSWVYALDGTLRAAPGFEKDPRVTFGKTTLPSVRVAEFGPLIFANLSNDGPELADVLAPIAGAEKKWEPLRFRETREYHYDSNWKTAIENSVECYHCPSIHPGVNSLVDLQNFEFSVHGLCGIQGGRRHENVRKDRVFQAATDPGDSETKTYFVWPNLWLIAYPGPSNLIIARWLPEGTAAAVCVRDFYFGDDFPADKQADFVSYVEQVQIEDLGICKEVYGNVSTGAFEHSLLRPDNSGLGEHGILQFQDLVLKAIIRSPAFANP